MRTLLASSLQSHLFGIETKRYSKTKHSFTASIAPLWNWNSIHISSNFSTLIIFNRTSLELKPHLQKGLFCTFHFFNRTSLELKLVIGKACWYLLFILQSHLFGIETSVLCIEGFHLHLQSHLFGIETIHQGAPKKPPYLRTSIAPLWNWNCFTWSIGYGYSTSIAPLWNWNCFTWSIGYGYSTSIAPLWNWNASARERASSRLAIFNRTSLELKLDTCFIRQFCLNIASIAPLWNWNSVKSSPQSLTISSSIAPLWNWNGLIMIWSATSILLQSHLFGIETIKLA